MSAGGDPGHYRRRLAAALRAVAGDPDLPVAFDGRPPGLDGRGAHLPAPGDVPDRSAWLEWRVLGDRVAALHRHPAPLRMAPPDEGRRAIFEALWQGRAEILVGRELPGVSRNLEDWLAMHWMREAPSLERLPLTERMRLSVHCVAGTDRLPEALRTALAHWHQARGIGVKALAAALDDPRRYAAVSLRLARSLSPREPRERRPVSARQPARQRPTPSGTERRPERRGRRMPAAPATLGGALPVESPTGGPYHVYTRAHDETLRPGDLASPQELAVLRRRLEEAVPRTTRLVTRLARRLEHALQARRPRRWREAEQGSRLDPRRLSRLVADPAGRGIYRERSAAFTRDTVVTLLLDNSASMRGRRIEMAALCADLLARSLERCGIRTEILGYTTATWDGGPAAADWRAAGKPGRPGRLNARRHVIYKGADQPWRRARTGLGLMLKDELLKENLDGEALLWAARRLARRPERRRVLIVIGDGAPRDRATAAANGDGYLQAHLESTIAGIEHAGQAELLAVGIGRSVSSLYGHSTTVRDIDGLAPALVEELTAILAPGGNRGAGARQSPSTTMN